MIFDSHSHIDSSKFDDDRDLVIKRAKENGVTHILNPGADLESSMRAVELAQANEHVYAAVGVHPHEAKDMDDAMLRMIEHLAQKPKVVAIGEIGLDYYYDFSDRPSQKKWFIEQIRLAKRLKLPVIIHDRDASADVLEILKAENAFETGVLMHCFSGSAELAKQYVKLGAMLSIAGPVTFKNARKTVEVVEAVDLEHLLVETDAPYLSPEPKRGKRNEPMFVTYTVAKLAAIKGLTPEAVAKATMDNALRFFKIGS